MKILFDQGTPAPLRRELTGHTVDTVYERSWSELANGELLQKAEDAGYDVFVTTDQNLRYQQNLERRRIALSGRFERRAFLFFTNLLWGNQVFLQPELQKRSCDCTQRPTAALCLILQLIF